jgi:hypothetical protein
LFPLKKSGCAVRRIVKKLYNKKIKKSIAKESNKEKLEYLQKIDELQKN